MKELRRKVLLPAFQLTELTNQNDPCAIERSIKQMNGTPILFYHYRTLSGGVENKGFNYNLFPVVLDRNSAPWAIATLYILSKLESETQPTMSTFHAQADDLGAFKEWLDSQDAPDELLFKFPKPKLRRTTYRFRGFLQQQIQAREIAATTAKRRMGTVIAFYKWLVLKKYFTPENPTWEEKKYQLLFRNGYGKSLSTTISTSDLSIPAPKAEDDFDGSIQDGGKLRPLTAKEQGWLLEAAEVKRNTECLLLQLFMIGTGARIESAATLRARHFSVPEPRYAKSLLGEGEVYRLKAGPGTGIDTKNNKPGTFQVPRPLYELLHTYALSTRAALRRQRYSAKNGEHPDIYLFLTNQGSPYYISKNDSLKFNPHFNRRHIKNGQAIRQFIKDHGIPYVRKKYDNSFHYRPHDLRASFGMNITEEMMKNVEQGKVSLHQVKIIVKDLMWHTSSSTTDGYLNYKEKIDSFYKAINNYGEYLNHWTSRAMKELKSEKAT